MLTPFGNTRLEDKMHSDQPKQLSLKQLIPRIIFIECAMAISYLGLLLSSGTHIIDTHWLSSFRYLAYWGMITLTVCALGLTCWKMNRRGTLSNTITPLIKPLDYKHPIGFSMDFYTKAMVFLALAISLSVISNLLINYICHAFKVTPPSFASFATFIIATFLLYLMRAKFFTRFVIYCHTATRLPMFVIALFMTIGISVLFSVFFLLMHLLFHHFPAVLTAVTPLPGFFDIHNAPMHSALLLNFWGVSWLPIIVAMITTQCKGHTLRTLSFC